jgi:hypothetical protein
LPVSISGFLWKDEDDETGNIYGDPRRLGENLQAAEGQRRRASTPASATRRNSLIKKSGSRQSSARRPI